MTDAQHSGLLSLPKEVLLRIRYHTHSLSDHVNLSLTCRATYALYDSKFWEFACTSAGYGMKIARPDQVYKLENKKDQLWPWTGLARIVVSDRAFFRPYKFSETLGDEAVIEREAGPKARKKRTLLKNTRSDKVKYLPGFVGYHTYDTYDEDIYLRFMVDLVAEEKTVDMAAILDHPCLANRFITIPPSNELEIDTGLVDYPDGHEDYDEDMDPEDYLPIFCPNLFIENKNGITVGDVYLKFGEEYACTNSYFTGRRLTVIALQSS